MISAKELNSFRERLVRLGEALHSKRQNLRNEAMQGTGSGGISKSPIHLGDLGSREAEVDIDFGLVENVEAMLQEINDALERIDEGTFGQCDSCSQPIGKDRLNALPYARYCIRCATQDQSK